MSIKSEVFKGMVYYLILISFGYFIGMFIGYMVNIYTAVSPPVEIHSDEDKQELNALIITLV